MVAVAGNFDVDKLRDCLNSLFVSMNRKKLQIPEFADCNGFAPRKMCIRDSSRKTSARGKRL